MMRDGPQNDYGGDWLKPVAIAMLRARAASPPRYISGWGQSVDMRPARYAAYVDYAR